MKGRQIGNSPRQDNHHTQRTTRLGLGCILYPRRVAAGVDHSPNARAERAELKSCKDDKITAQGKRGTSAALGMRHKMIRSLVSNRVWRPKGAKPDWKQERLGAGWCLPRAAASAALPWAVIRPPLTGLRRPPGQ